MAGDVSFDKNSLCQLDSGCLFFFCIGGASAMTLPTVCLTAAFSDDQPWMALFFCASQLDQLLGPGLSKNHPLVVMASDGTFFNPLTLSDIRPASDGENSWTQGRERCALVVQYGGWPSNTVTP